MVNTSTAPDLQDRRVDPWCRPKGTTRNLPTGAEPMAAAAGRCAVEQAPHRAVLENEVSRQQVRRGQQRPHELTCPIERRVGHDAKRPVRQHEIAERHLDDCDRRSGESVSQALRPPGVQLDARTRAPMATSGAVSAPSPAPRSSTRSPERTGESSTMRSAQSASRACQPQARRAPALDDAAPDTADHHEEPVATHGGSLGWCPAASDRITSRALGLLYSACSASQRFDTRFGARISQA